MIAHCTIMNTSLFSISQNIAFFIVIFEKGEIKFHASENEVSEGLLIVTNIYHYVLASSIYAEIRAVECFG